MTTQQVQDEHPIQPNVFISDEMPIIQNVRNVQDQAPNLQKLCDICNFPPMINQHLEYCDCKKLICSKCIVPFQYASNIFCTKCRSSHYYTTNWQMKLCTKCNQVRVHGDKIPQTWCGTGIDYRLYWRKCHTCDIDVCSHCQIICQNIECKYEFCSTACWYSHISSAIHKTRTCIECSETKNLVEQNDSACSGKTEIYWEQCYRCDEWICNDCQHENCKKVQKLSDPTNPNLGDEIQNAICF
jgi:hypothetical protein